MKNKILELLDEIKSRLFNKLSKKVIIIAILSILILVILVNVISYYSNKKIKETAIHGVVVEDNVKFYRKPKESKWKLIRDLEIGENIYIIEEAKDNKWYKIMTKDKIGYVQKEDVDYYEFSDKDGNVLMSDVSKFNVQYEHFTSAEDYEVFILNCDINYVYIRAGGRGYGEEGNFYTDKQCKLFIEACEYLGVPYGFYYIDEAITSEEIEEEVEFMENFIKENATDFCVLPVVIDIEKHDGVGRADELWEERASLATELIQKFKEKNIETIVYSNANLINEYLYTIDTKFWIAYYNLEKKIPNYWYTETNQEAAKNSEFTQKIIAWQFTETGAGEEIPYPVDVSIVDNAFFRKYVDKILEE